MTELLLVFVISHYADGSKPNLEKAANYVCQSEAVKKQQETVQGTPTSNFTPTDDAINVVNKAISQYNATSRSHKQSDRAKKTLENTLRAKSFNQVYSKCTRCRKSPMHTKQQCPAREAICHHCSKKGHFKSMC